MKELVTIQSKLKAPKSQYNSFGKYKYRSAEDILEAVKPILKEVGCYLILSDTIELIGNRYYIKATATLTNKDGVSVSNTAYAREDEVKKGQDGSQITGTSSSYARKYAMNGLFLIDDTKDADTDEYHNQTTQQVDTKKLMATACKEMSAAKSLDEIQTLWNKYSAYPDIIKNGSDFYNLTIESGKKFKK